MNKTLKPIMLRFSFQPDGLRRLVWNEITKALSMHNAPPSLIWTIRRVQNCVRIHTEIKIRKEPIERIEPR